VSRAIPAGGLGLVVAWALAAGPAVIGGCEARTSDERVREKARQEILRTNERNREWQLERQENVTAVGRYKRWFARLNAMDHPALGLPEPEPLHDGIVRPATTSATFCQRVARSSAGQVKPTPEQWTAAFREYVARFVVVLEPGSYEELRAHYIAERHLARLACIARDGGPGLRQTLLDLLTASDAELDGDFEAGIDAAPASVRVSLVSVPYGPWPDGDTENRWMVGQAVRYAAAVYAINQGLGPAQVDKALDLLSKAGSLFGFELHDRLQQDTRPVSLGYDLASGYHTVQRILRRDLKERRLRNGQVRSARP